MTLTAAPGSNALSRAEDKIIAEIFEAHGDKDEWELVDHTHTLPEWEDPGSSATDISYQDVLRIEGLSADEIRDILDNIEAQNDFACIMDAA